MELLGQEFYSNCLPDIDAWFADLKLGSVRSYTVKVMLNGNGNIGKSSLAEALQGGRCESTKLSTNGIRIETLHLSNEDKPVQLQLFDFGGQELYHGAHKLFLRSRAVQLLVFDAETEALSTAPDRVTGEEVRNISLQYWYNDIARLSPDSQFLLVQNKKDLPARLPNETRALLNQLDDIGIQSIKVSATGGDGIAALRGYIVDLAKRLPEYGMEMPLSWHEARQYFIDNLIQPKEKRERLMTRTDFDELCRRKNVRPASVPALLRYLHHTGALFADEKFLGDKIIADQEWAIEAIYKALDRNGELYDILRNLSHGRTKARHLFSRFGDEYTELERWLFLSLMESCGLCFPLKDDFYEASDPDTIYVFPEFLPVDKPSVVAEYLTDTKNKSRIFRQQVPFLPYHHIQTLIARCGPKTDFRNVWRTGFMAFTLEGRFVLEADLAAHTLTLTVAASLSAEWVQDLKRSFSMDGIEWEEMTPTNVAEPPPTPPIHERAPTNRLESLPDVTQKKQKELVISYASQDERYLKLLSNMVAGDEEVFLWYDRKLSSREAWDEQLMGHFQSADGIVIILSTDYLNADHKLYIHEKELPLIQSRFKDSNATLPIIIIRVDHATNERKTLLKDYLMFDKGAIMPCPDKDKLGASEYVARFLKEWVFKEL